VRFQEEAIGPCRGRRRQQRWNELALAATTTGLSPTRLLHCMRSIKDDGHAAQVAEAAEIPHVDNQIAVAEERSAFSDCNVGGSGAPYLLHCATHRLGIEPLPLLDIDGLARASSRDKKVGLAAEKRRDLEGIDYFRDNRSLLGFVDVGEHREATRSAHPLECTQPLIQAGAAASSQSGSVGLVEASLEAHRQPKITLDSRKLLCNPEEDIAGLYDAGPGNQKGRSRKGPTH
jgi:hypothetical protein